MIVATSSKIITQLLIKDLKITQLLIKRPKNHSSNDGHAMLVVVICSSENNSK